MWLQECLPRNFRVFSFNFHVFFMALFSLARAPLSIEMFSTGSATSYGFGVFLASILKTNLKHLARQVTHGNLSGKILKKTNKNHIWQNSPSNPPFSCGKLHLSKKQTSPPNPRNTCFGWKIQIHKFQGCWRSSKFPYLGFLKGWIWPEIFLEHFCWTAFSGGGASCIYIYIIYLQYI